MAYMGQAQIANEQKILLRVQACAANLGEEQPGAWAPQQMWKLAITPGWDTAFETKGAEGITDAMILAAVQELREVSDGV